MTLFYCVHCLGFTSTHLLWATAHSNINSTAASPATTAQNRTSNSTRREWLHNCTHSQIKKVQGDAVKAISSLMDSEA